MKLDAGREPIFVFDSREEFKPVAVESVEALKATLVGPDGGPGGPLSLGSLPEEGGRMNLPPDPKKGEATLPDELRRIGYRRVMAGAGLKWVQYWLWYLYNPKRVFITGEHEGDWEFVQVGYAGDLPVCMTCSQHRSGGSRMWWDIELRDGRPTVYPALGSHANYFKPVEQVPEIGDTGDGEGEVLDSIEWRSFGPWAKWGGRWGNSTGEGKSPQSPGSQGDRWHAPHLYHSDAGCQH
jgi:hypothetical protein